MMFRRLGLINKNQRGFTMIELVIAIAIVGLITSGVTMTIFQVLNGNARSRNHMIAVRQVQNAGYWVSHDGQMAQGVVITGTSGFPLTLTWTDWETSDEYKVVYTLLDDNKLQREHYTNTVLDETSFMAQFIDPDNTNCEFAGGSAFSLPDAADAYTITGGAEADSGIITVTAGSISVTTDGGATYDSGTGAWTTPAGGGTIVVTANGGGTSGTWTAITGTATAAITADDVNNPNATLADGGVLVFTVTATVGTGSPQEASKTRVYKITPRPDL